MSPARSSPVRAPALRGRWLGTGGRDLTLEQLGGRVVLLHFWTASSLASVAVLDDVRALVERFPAELAVVGVHTPKFAHEAEPGVLAAAVERYGIRHPVLDDADWFTWSAYGVTSWPTFVLVDPAGQMIATMAGASHSAGLGAAVAWVVEEHRARGTLAPRAGEPTPRAAPAATTSLRFPGKAVAMPTDRRLAGAGWRGCVLASDTAHAQLVVLAPDLETEAGRVGTGEPGVTDGGPGTARFTAPQGLAVLPQPVAAAVGYDVVVADSGAHALRGLNLADGSVRTLAAGSGVPAPLDVAWFDGFVAVAMADAHQVWAFVPAVDPTAARLRVLAGTGYEGLVDGEAHRAWFAQPSGLSASPDGQTLWVADAQTSSIRWLRRALVGGYEVGTGVGRGLFDSGFTDGARDEALLQHPLGVTALPDGSIAVADTYNGAVRRFDPRTGEVTTLAGSLREPSGVVATDEGVVVVESAAHRLVRVPSWPDGGRRVRRRLPGTRRPVLELAPGTVHVEVRFRPGVEAAGDGPRGGPDEGSGEGNGDGNGEGAHTWLALSTEPDDLLERGLGASPGLHRDMVLPDPAAGGYDGGVVHVAAGAAGRYEQDWALPVRVVRGGATRITLDLRHP
jgi:DNA-binding beta-propeller fold protein YncE